MASSGSPASSSASSRNNSDDELENGEELLSSNRLSLPEGRSASIKKENQLETNSRATKSKDSDDGKQELVAKTPSTSISSIRGPRRRRCQQQRSEKDGGKLSSMQSLLSSSKHVPEKTGCTDSPKQKQHHKHPLCRCPSCPKILPPQGLFGHFGRVHSGQLGHSVRFKWEEVQFVCPFCPGTKKGEEERRAIFPTIKSIEAHVAEEHEHCHLVKPNATSGGAARRPHPKPDDAGGSPRPSRKSRRGSVGGRRSSAPTKETAEVDDDEKDGAESAASSSPISGATRKSRRRRKMVVSGATINHNTVINNSGLVKCSVVPTASRVARQRGAGIEEKASNKALYSCPDCDKTNLTKHGLHAHYGMVHGGKVDMGQVKIVRKVTGSTKVGEGEPGFGPWSDEEHAAFLEGHRLHGNRWKLISVKFVPTRDAKQVGSHALNFFTTRGEWSKTQDGRTRAGGGGGGEEGVEVERRSKRENAGKRVIDRGDDEEEEGEEELTGKEVCQGDEKVASDPQKETASSSADSDDGNSAHCIVCFQGGNIVCCSRCPRAYHPKCLAKDGQGNFGGGVNVYNVDLLPNDWQCNRCRRDDKVGDGEEISQYQFGNKKIRAAYAEFKECSDYGNCCALLSNILDVLKKLMKYDYGYVFSEPVEGDGVPDYLDVVKKPMDYGTVSERLENGNYVDLIASDDMSRDDENSCMEDILLHVICDIDRVHHNCRIYNREGSSIFRIGDVHSSKWNAYFDQYILEKLPENVKRDLALFRHNCRLDLEDGNHSKRRLREQQQLQAKKKKARDRAAKEKSEKKATKSPSIMVFSAAASLSGRKRKASEELEEEASRHEGSEDEVEMEEEDEPPSPKRKTKRAGHQDQQGHDVGGSPSKHSKALLFTEDQMRSLEHVYFTSADRLRVELNELDECSALTSVIGCSPSASFGANDGIPRALECPIMNVDDKVDGALTGVRSEVSLHDLPHQSGVSSTAAGVATAAMVPEVISSGPTTGLLERPLALPKTSPCSTPIGNVHNDSAAPKQNESPSSTNIAQDQGASNQQQGTAFQRQWYERLNELKNYKIKHGTAVCQATSNEKLYHWRLRQRKRYHLTLFRMPHFKKAESLHGWEDPSSVDKNDKGWILTLPEMKGVFLLSATADDGTNTDVPTKPFVLKEKDVEEDEKNVKIINLKHREQLYCPPLLPIELLVAHQQIQAHSSLHSNSLFWDECLEELRFFEGEHGHTVVPRDFPYNSYLAVWVEIQRAKYLLQYIGVYTGLTGSQVLALDELNFCDLSSLPTMDAILVNDGSSPTSALAKSTPKKIKKMKQEGNAPDRKSWTIYASDFKEWYQKLPSENKSKASELLPRQNWPLYSWCWRQCNASAAVLCGTPNVRGINMSVKKLNTLSKAKFFHSFPYNEYSGGGLVCEDDYVGSDAFDSTFRVLEEFSIKYGTTTIPDWYDCDRAFRMWVLALGNGLANFVKGEPCVLTAKQIEKLILIGFFNDRDHLPNLSKGDVVWLKMFSELKRHLELFGVCNVSSDFPHLHQWIADQKELFRLSRTGKEGINMMNASRLKMLMEIGVDFFTGECLPGTSSLIISKGHRDFRAFEILTSSPAESFPAAYMALNNQAVYGWDFQCDDNYWKNNECMAKFEMLKARNGHSLVVASDDIDVYWWFVEKRGKALLSEINSSEFGEGFESNGLFSHSILRYVTALKHADGDDIVDPNAKIGSVDHSMFLWLHYCERLMIFKAREGHCKIPKEYPDTPLRQWLVQQQELIHLYSTNQPIELRQVQLKLLHALGVHGTERHATLPKLSSRMMKRKHPSRKRDKKQQRDVEK